MADEQINPEQLQTSLEDTTVQETASLISPDDLAGTLESQGFLGSKHAESLAGQLVTVNGKAMDEASITLAASEGDPASALAMATQESYNDMERSIAQQGLNSLSAYPAGATAAVQETTSQLSHINTLRQHPFAAELAVIQNATTIPLEDAVHQEVALNLAVRNELFKLSDEQGKLDFTLDVLPFFIPGVHTAKWESAKEAIAEDTELGAIMTGDSIAGMIGSWQALPLDRRTVLYPKLIETIIASSGTEGAFGIRLSEKNTTAAIAELIRFFQPEGGERASFEQKAFLALDVAAVIPVGKLVGAARGAKGARGSTPFDFVDPITGKPTGGAPSMGKGTPRKPTAEQPFPKTDPLGGATVEGEVVGKSVADVAKLPQAVRKDMEIILSSATEFSSKKYSNIHNAAMAGDLKMAAQMNAAALDADFIRRAHAISTDEAIINAMPFQTKEWLPQAVEGLVPDMATTLNDFVRVAEGKVRSMTTESDLMRVGALSKSERQYAVNNFLQDMERKGEDFMLENVTLSNVKILTESTDGFEFAYTLTNKEGLNNMPAFSKTFEGRRAWRVNNVTGQYEETVGSLTATSASNIPGLSPSAWSVMGGKGTLDFGNTVKTAIQLEDIALASKDRINALWLDANASLNSAGQHKARARIEAVELAGDDFLNKSTHERGRVFSPRELYAGIDTHVGTVRITAPAEVEAYYKRRLVADAFHGMQNYVTRRELELGGFKSLEIKTDGGLNLVFAKPFETVDNALASIGNKEGFAIYRESDGVVINATEQVVRDMYDNGHMLMRSREDWNVSGNQMSNGGEWVEYIQVSPANIRQLPEQVLNYKYGYVPKIWEGVEYIVKQNFPKTKRGASATTRSEAVRAFASLKDAKLFAQGMAENFATKNNIPMEDAILMFEIADGSTLSQMERMEDALSGTNGLFTGTRAKKDILMGASGIPMTRVAPSQAYGRYIDSLGNKVSKNEWRIGQEMNWINTVRRLDPDAKIRGFHGTRLSSSPQGKALEKLRGQIDKWNRVPSKGETLWEAGAQKLHDFVLTGSKKLGLQKESVASALWLKHAEPGHALLGANMHTMLGAMNPVQLYVQGSAAVVALSLAPIKAIPNILSKTARFAVLDNVQNPDTLQKVLDGMVSQGQMTAPTREMYMGWHRSGLREAVRSNADMNYMANTGLGITNDVLRKASNTSLLIYRSGELFNRRVSFMSAYTRWKEANPKAKLDDDNLTLVLQEANKSMLELNAANKAWWQGGHGATAAQKVLQVTSQFQQVMAKTLELSFKGTKRGGFTGGEKARIVAGQLAMFGAAGVPLVSMVAPAFVDWYTDTTGADEDSERDTETTASMANTVNQGFTGYISREIFGAEVETATRASLGFGVLSTAQDIITSEDPLWLKLLAVSGNTLQRAGTAVVQGSALIKSHALAALAENEPLALGDRRNFTNFSNERMLAIGKDIGFLMLSIPSSSRNALKARMMAQSNAIMDRRGRPVITADFNYATEMGVAIGFRPTAESRVREVQKDNRYYDELVEEASDLVMASYHRYVYIHKMQPQYADNLRDLVQYVQETLGNEHLVEQLRSRLESRMFTNPQSLQERELKKYFDRTATDRIERGMIMDSEQMFNPSKIFSPQPVVVPFQDLPSKGDK